MKFFPVFIIVFVLLICCTKKIGTNPSLAYSNGALLDSCKQAYHHYYKNDSSILPGAHGPHGTFKLRFNSIALKALTDNGKLPTGGKFPDGSLIIKDAYKGSDIEIYAMMYKKSGSWLWAEIKPDKKVVHGVNDNSGVCTGCHSQSGNRDLVVSFNFY